MLSNLINENISSIYIEKIFFENYGINGENLSLLIRDKDKINLILSKRGEGKSFFVYMISILLFGFRPNITNQIRFNSDLSQINEDFLIFGRTNKAMDYEEKIKEDRLKKYGGIDLTISSNDVNYLIEITRYRDFHLEIYINNFSLDGRQIETFMKILEDHILKLEKLIFVAECCITYRKV